MFPFPLPSLLLFSLISSFSLIPSIISSPRLLPFSLSVVYSHKEHLLTTTIDKFRTKIKNIISRHFFPPKFLSRAHTTMAVLELNYLLSMYRPFPFHQSSSSLVSFIICAIGVIAYSLFLSSFVYLIGAHFLSLSFCLVATCIRGK